MMHRCSSSHHQQQGNMVGAPCSCGLFHGQSNSFSMFFSMPNNHQCYKSFDENEYMYPFPSPSFSAASSSAVDCTLSLGTPSTRLTEDDDKRMSSSYSSSSRHRHHNHHRNIERRSSASSSSCMSNFCWDILQPKNNTAAAPPQPNSNKAAGRGNSDPLLARRCANCDTTSTPLWRNGPRGPKSLCNACGIRFKKEERRATAASGNTSTYINANAGVAAAAAGGIEMEQQHYGSSYQYHQNGSSGGSTSWGGLQSQKVACFSPANEFRFIEESDRDSSDTGGIPFLSWRLNVTDRPSLVHDFTR